MCYFVATEVDSKRLQELGAKFLEYAPHFTGPVPPERSVIDVLEVAYGASWENGDGGSFVSHFGTKRWL